MFFSDATPLRNWSQYYNDVFTSFGIDKAPSMALEENLSSASHGDLYLQICDSYANYSYYRKTKKALYDQWGRKALPRVEDQLSVRWEERDNLSPAQVLMVNSALLEAVTAPFDRSMAYQFVTLPSQGRWSTVHYGPMLSRYPAAITAEVLRMVR